MGACCRGFEPGRIDGDHPLILPREQSRLPALGDDLPRDDRHIAAFAEFRQRGVMRQFGFKPQNLPELSMSLEEFDQASVADLQIGFQNESAHQLPLGEVMPTLVGTEGREMPTPDLHHQFHNPFDPRFHK